jgi:hypothetical protein
MGQAVQRASAADTVHYEPRRPEDTTLYQLVQEHRDTFLAQVEAQTGAALPEFVKDEFNAFLECGILAHGFLRLRCAGRIPMRSGWRSRASGAGCARRAGRAAHGRNSGAPGRLRDPAGAGGVNGCGLFRSRSRILLAAHPQLLSAVLQIVHRVIATFLIKQAGAETVPSPHRRGHADDLAKAIRAYGRGYFIRNDYYNGINFAFLLDVRAANSQGGRCDCRSRSCETHPSRGSAAVRCGSCEWRVEGG